MIYRNNYSIYLFLCGFLLEFYSFVYENFVSISMYFYKKWEDNLKFHTEAYTKQSKIDTVTPSLKSTA